MEREFNTTGLCVPEKHYMVNLDTRLEAVQRMIDKGQYFTINRARQFGKTTLLNALQKYIREKYYSVFLDFQQLGNACFENENAFSLAFAEYFVDEADFEGCGAQGKVDIVVNKLKDIAARGDERFNLMQLFKVLSELCGAADKPVVLIVDEVDSASNNQVFLDFLAQLRNYYLKRDRKGTATFQSVILAGVYDVRNLRSKIRPEEEHKINSPWNIAADYEIDMSFSKAEIAGMLREYEADKHTGMDVEELAGYLFDDTSGYPFLVSRLCKLMDQNVSREEGFAGLSDAWTRKGFLAAERMLLTESNMLFKSLKGKLETYKELNHMLYSILFSGEMIPYNRYNSVIDIAQMFGFVKNDGGKLAVANRIFETWLYNLYLSENEMKDHDIYKASLRDKNQFTDHGVLNMELILEKFAMHYSELFGKENESFHEEKGRKFFLLYLRPIINGVGNYYIEAQTRDLLRTDLIIDYLGKQYIVEMKIWHGDAYNTRGEQQLAEYLDAYHLKKGYMLSFNFNKNKTVGIHTVAVGDRELIEAVV